MREKFLIFDVLNFWKFKWPFPVFQIPTKICRVFSSLSFLNPCANIKDLVSETSVKSIKNFWSWFLITPWLGFTYVCSNKRKSVPLRGSGNQPTDYWISLPAVNTHKWTGEACVIDSGAVFLHHLYPCILLLDFHDFLYIPHSVQDFNEIVFMINIRYTNEAICICKS